MTFNFDSEVDIKLDFDYEEIFKKTAEAALDFTGCPYEICVNLLLTDDENIREINRENRNIDASTDVLSFPMNLFPAGGDFALIEEDPFAFDAQTDELLLGDIVLSQDHIIAQAEEYGHSLLREYAFLIAHSMLHLQGYDHMDDEDRIIMEAAQKSIMDSLNILR